MTSDYYAEIIMMTDEALMRSNKKIKNKPLT